MVQRRCRFRLALEAAERLGFGGEIIGQELQRDVAAQFQVFGFIDHSHSAPTDLAQDTVMADGLSCRLEWRRHGRNVRTARGASQIASGSEGSSSANWKLALPACWNAELGTACERKAAEIRNRR